MSAAAVAAAAAASIVPEDTKPKPSFDINGYITDAMRIFPSGIIFVLSFYALVTQSLPFAVFSLSMLEAYVIYDFIRWVFSYMPFGRLTLAENYPVVCRSGFGDLTNSSLNSLRLFPVNLESTGLVEQFPSFSIYMISAASGYVFSTLNSQKKDLEVLGPTDSLRYYTSMFSLFLFICAFMCFRFIHSCEPFESILLSVPIGLLVGILLVYQNARLFNKSSINLLGIPQLSSVTANGNKLYICPKV